MVKWFFNKWFDDQDSGTAVFFHYIFLQVLFLVKGTKKGKNERVSGLISSWIQYWSLLIFHFIWMSNLKFNWIIDDLSGIKQLFEFAWTLRSSIWVVFNHFLFKVATDRSKISSNRYRIQFDANLYPLLFFANTPFKLDSTFNVCV